MKRKINEMKLRLPAISVNEAVARSVISAFVAELDPTVEELGDIRCAVSEAVTNCTVHAYPASPGEIVLDMGIYEDGRLRVAVIDHGCGIPDVAQAMTPLFTTGAIGERSGLGFSVMESFMDSLRVRSKVGQGTTVTMRKKIICRGRKHG